MGSKKTKVKVVQVPQPVQIPQPVHIPSPPPIEESPAFAQFAESQRRANEINEQLLGLNQQLVNAQLPELQAQYNFGQQQRGFVSPILGGGRLPGDYSVLGTPLFSDAVGGQLLNRLNAQTKESLLSQGQYDSGIEAELLNQNALNLATSGEQYRRGELGNLASLASGLQFAPPNVSGSIGAGAQIAGNTSNIGANLLNPLMTDRGLLSNIAAQNAAAFNNVSAQNASAMNNVAYQNAVFGNQANQFNASQPTLGGQLGGFAGNLALAYAMGGGNPIGAVAGGIGSLLGGRNRTGSRFINPNIPIPGFGMNYGGFLPTSTNFNAFGGY